MQGSEEAKKPNETQPNHWNSLRNTQQAIEILGAPTTANVRVTQCVIEVLVGPAGAGGRMLRGLG